MIFLTNKIHKSQVDCLFIDQFIINPVQPFPPTILSIT